MLCASAHSMEHTGSHAAGSRTADSSGQDLGSAVCRQAEATSQKSGWTSKLLGKKKKSNQEVKLGVETSLGSAGIIRTLIEHGHFLRNGRAHWVVYWAFESCRGFLPPTCFLLTVEVVLKGQLARTALNYSAGVVQDHAGRPQCNVSWWPHRDSLKSSVQHFSATNQYGPGGPVCHGGAQTGRVWRPQLECV